jgi:hypothetical protein
MKLSLLKAAKAMLAAPILVGVLALAIPGTAFATTSTPTTPAASCDTVTGGVSGGVGCSKPTNAPNQLFGEGGVFVAVTNVMIYVIGGVAVIMLIVGGIRYVVSAGDQAAVTGAKNTILYAIIGIVVAVISFAAVQFISNALPTGTAGNAYIQTVLGS